MNTFITIVKSILLAIACSVVVLCILPAYKQINGEYTKTIIVDKSEKIPQALTNAIIDVQSRNFVIANIEVKKGIFSDTFLVTAEGIDAGTFLSIGK